MPSLLGLILVVAIIYLAVSQFAKIDRGGPSDAREQIRMIDEEQARGRDGPALTERSAPPRPTRPWESWAPLQALPHNGRPTLRP